MAPGGDFIVSLPVGILKVAQTALHVGLRYLCDFLDKYNTCMESNQEQVSAREMAQ